MFSRREFFAMLAGAPLAVKGLLCEPGAVPNVWWEVLLPWTPPQPGLGKSHGCIRFWKEGVPGQVYMPCQYIPGWLTPKDLAEVFARHEGKTDFVRIRNADNSECFDFYCVPTMQDEMERGSLHDTGWSVRPTQGGLAHE